jgi:hypothetical protein
MRYNIATGVKHVKTKTQKTLIGLTALTFPAVIALSGGVASAAVGYSLFGDATIVSGGNPGNAVQMISSTTNPYGGVDYTDATGFTFNNLTNLGTDYKITAGDCGGGSPRFQVNIGGHNVFVYIGPFPSFTGCTLNTWVSTGNLTTSPDARFDTSQYAGGNFYSTYAQAEALLGTQTVTGVQLVTDSGWAVAGGNQTVLADNTQINTTTYTYEVPQPQNKNDCKNGGWMDLARANGSTFKNQGDCVSYTNTGR